VSLAIVSWGCPLEGYVFPRPLFLSLLPSLHEVSSFVLPCDLHHDAQFCLRPKVMEPSNHGWKPLKLSQADSFLLFKLLMSGILSQ
jgi:hypothetical protein